MSGCPLNPLGNRIVVKRVGQKEKTESGLFIPDEAIDKSPKGEVVAVGRGKWNRTTGAIVAHEVKVGDTVIFAEHAGTEIKYKGEWYLILKGEDIHSVVDSEVEVG